MTKNMRVFAVAGTIAIAAVATPTTADAGGRGGAVAAGIIGGLAAGAFIGSAIAAPGYYYAGPYYAGSAPCYWRRQRIWDGYAWVNRRVRFCY